MTTSTLSSSTIAVAADVTKKNWRTPHGDLEIKHLIGHVGKWHDEQQTAATATTQHVAKHPGSVQRLLITTANLAASTETMTFDIQKNGTTILSATPVIAHTTTPVGVHDVTFLLAAAPTQINQGDIISIIRTLANGSTLTLTEVQVEWG